MALAFASGGGGGGAAGAITQAFHSQLAADALSIDTGANGIAGSGLHLQIVLRMRTDEAVVATAAKLTLNGDAGANYDRAVVVWNGVAIAFGSGYAGANFPLDCVGNSADANRFTTGQVVFVDYADTASFKQGNALDSEIGTPANANVRLAMGATWTWKSTAAINQVTLAPSTGGAKFKAGSSMTIYVLS